MAADVVHRACGRAPFDGLPAWRLSRKRKPLASSKYYFFDVGVVGELHGRPLRIATPEFGQAFETWLFHELLCHRDYASGEPLHFWRTTSNFEVDFIVGDHTAIEVKATEHVSADDLRGLRALAEEGALRHYLCGSLERRRRAIDGIVILPYAEFLDGLWGGEWH